MEVILTSKESVQTSTPATLAQIERAEQQLGTTFASDYRQYLAEYGRLSYGSHEWTGITDIKRLDVVAVTQDLRPSYQVPSDWYVVEDTYFETLVVWQAPTAEVYLVGMMAQPQKIADSLVDYLQQD